MEYHLDIEQIRKFLPHRYPFLMVDRILGIEPKGDLRDRAFTSDKVGTRVIGIKCVSYNEPMFQGHFPNFSIFPGVMIVETMAQVASFSIWPYIKDDVENLSKDLKTILLGMDGVRFRRPVVPGDTIRVETVVNHCRGKMWKFSVHATVEGERVAEGELLANIFFEKEAI